MTDQTQEMTNIAISDLTKRVSELEEFVSKITFYDELVRELAMLLSKHMK